MRRLDLPPLWLLGFLILAWALSRLDPWGLGFGGWAQLPAGLLLGGGVVLIAVAVRQMREARTPVTPRREASRLMTTGVFARSRNPIYLAMALILLGWVLRLDAALALPLLPIFVWVIERRFILPEEAMLRRRFPEPFALYTQATRRWL